MKNLDINVYKLCDKCKTPMYIRRRDDVDELIGCDYTLVAIRLSTLNDKEVVIKATTSKFKVKCNKCTRIHLLKGFKKVK